ncbi:MAG: hypothetical protein ACLFQJ_10070, partial [Campylobacterales bacterium]
QNFDVALDFLVESRKLKPDDAVSEILILHKLAKLTRLRFKGSEYIDKLEKISNKIGNLYSNNLNIIKEYTDILVQLSRAYLECGYIKKAMKTIMLAETWVVVDNKIKDSHMHLCKPPLKPYNSNRKNL